MTTFTFVENFHPAGRLCKDAARIIRHLAGVMSNTDRVACTAFYRKFGFTLAEVLITLGIIGVVAAITIPNFITKYQKQVTVTKLKKAYSTFENAIKLSENVNGSLDTWQYQDITSDEFAQKYILPHLNGVRQVKKDYEIVTLGGNAPDLAFISSAYFSLTNNMYILPDGTYVYIVISPDYTAFPFCYIYVDLNGKKKPNMLGKDVFVFCITREAPKKFEIYGRSSNLSRDDLINPIYGSCVKTDTYNYYKGQTCGLLIQMDSWKISDDYPW